MHDGLTFSQWKVACGANLLACTWHPSLHAQHPAACPPRATRSRGAAPVTRTNLQNLSTTSVPVATSSHHQGTPARAASGLEQRGECRKPCYLAAQRETRRHGRRLSWNSGARERRRRALKRFLSSARRLAVRPCRSTRPPAPPSGSTMPVDDDPSRRSWLSSLCRCAAPAAAVCWLALAGWRSRVGWARAGGACVCERERESRRAPVAR